MKSNKIAIELALDSQYCIQQGYQYVWAQELSRVVLGKLQEIELEQEQLIEARIFNEEKEIHIFQLEDTLVAVETIQEKQDYYVDEVQLLKENYGKTITMRNYIDYEEDGQAYFSRTVIAGYEAGGVADA